MMLLSKPFSLYTVGTRTTREKRTRASTSPGASATTPSPSGGTTQTSSTSCTKWRRRWCHRYKHRHNDWPNSRKKEQPINPSAIHCATFTEDLGEMPLREYTFSLQIECRLHRDLRPDGTSMKNKMCKCLCFFLSLIFFPPLFLSLIPVLVSTDAYIP